jgi:hypothetical protein
VMEMSNDHQLNMVPLPKNCRVGACCNAAPDIYTTLIPCPALISRFVMIPFQPLVPEWQYHFDNTLHGHPAISKYILKVPGDLDVPEGILEPYKQYPNRRGWVKFSKALYEMKERGFDLIDGKDKDKYEGFLLKIAAGYIGDMVAISFVDFVNKDYKVYTPEDILDKWTQDMSYQFTSMPVTEISYYSKLLVKYAGSNKLSGKQHASLTAWFIAIDKEAAAGFYQLFINTEREACTTWYKSDPSIGSYVMDELLAERK